MMERVSFSIIIPLYNKEKTIKSTLQSLSQLEYKDYEVVVVDDGSTDNSANIVRSIDDEHIKLYSKANGGVSSARNYGAEMASYDWIIFLDADDVLLPSTLSDFQHLIISHPHDSVFAGNYYTSKEDRLTLKSKKSFISENPHKDTWNENIYLRPGAFCCRKIAFELSGGYDERISYNEDFEYALRLCNRFRVVFTCRPVMRYIIEDGTASIKVHRLDKDFCYYYSDFNMSNTYVKEMCYRRIIKEISRRGKAGDSNGANSLNEICTNKFGKYYRYHSFVFTVSVFIKYKFRQLSNKLGL